MILSPSDIHFLHDATADLSGRFLQGGERIPKVQVAEKDGFWFALNNSSLHIVRDLEKKGRCAKIRVEVVPLSKVPETLQKGMTVQADDNECVRGNERRLPEETSDDTSSYTSSDDSDYDRDEDPTDTEEEDDEEEEDDLSCNVCDRSFSSSRLLSRHQMRRRHFGCSVCDACFPDLRALERHKESLEHWSEDEGNTYESDSCDSDEVPPSAGRSDEMERLL